jgi:FixJ family two-component response regulator
MPGMSGVEFLRRAKDIYPESVRMILLGDVDLPVAITAVNDGAISRLLLKALDEENLGKYIEQAIRVKEMADDSQHQRSMKVDELQIRVP